MFLIMSKDIVFTKSKKRCPWQFLSNTPTAKSFFWSYTDREKNQGKVKSETLISLSSECAFFEFKGVLHLWALFLKTLCIFSTNKATSDKVSYGSGQKCSKELENYSFISVETTVVKLQWKMCENQYFPCFKP